MTTHVTDKTICRYCRQKSPAVEIRLIKGIPAGECKRCNADRARSARLDKNFNLGLYRSLPSLIAANVKQLAMLKPGAYPIHFAPTRERDGYLVVSPKAPRTIYINICSDASLYRYDLFAVASLLGCQNYYIGSDPIPVLDGQSEPVALETIGRGMETLDATERMIWLDKALLDRAVKLVRDTERKYRQANMAIARQAKEPRT